jgi:hypothetical protein
VQQDAERVILTALGERMGCSFEQNTPPINGCRIDGVCKKPPVLVEVFAHQGALKGGQVRKVVDDAARLYTASLAFEPRPRLIFCFADESAARGFISGTGWRRKFLEAIDVDVVAAQISEVAAAAIRAAQDNQFR